MSPLNADGWRLRKILWVSQKAFPAADHPRDRGVDLQYEAPQEVGGDLGGALKASVGDEHGETDEEPRDSQKRLMNEGDEQADKAQQQRETEQKPTQGNNRISTASRTVRVRAPSLFHIQWLTGPLRLMKYRRGHHRIGCHEALSILS
jgi:hypothetical protein